MAVDESPANSRPIQGVHGREWGSMPILRLCDGNVTQVDTSPAIHRCHAYGIVQGRLLHVDATPMIFNWVALKNFALVSRCISLLRKTSPWGSLFLSRQHLHLSRVYIKDQSVRIKLFCYFG